MDMELERPSWAFMGIPQFLDMAGDIIDELASRKTDKVYACIEVIMMHTEIITS